MGLPCCCCLQVGHLIHGEAFSLFEAMSAVEMGNPKMDSGAQPPIAAPQLSLELPTAFTSEELVRIMDHHLLLEASWFIGNSFMQTLHSCTYFARCQQQ